MRLRLAVWGFVAALAFGVALFLIQSRPKPEITLPLLPRPSAVRTNASQFKINAFTRIACAPEAVSAAAWLSNVLSQSAGLRLETRMTGGAGVSAGEIVFVKAKDLRGSAEGYTLVVSPDTVVVEATGPPGFYYGTNTPAIDAAGSVLSDK